jgi:hypothetical protein
MSWRIPMPQKLWATKVTSRSPGAPHAPYAREIIFSPIPKTPDLPPCLASHSIYPSLLKVQYHVSGVSPVLTADEEGIIFHHSSLSSWTWI